MAQTTKIIRSNQEARLSKLKNKKTQLENLLRSRERLDFEIKNLKKSIKKDQKIVLKEYSLLDQTDGHSQESILESMLIEKEQDPEEEYQSSVKLLLETQNEFQKILDILLHFEEDPE